MLATSRPSSQHNDGQKLVLESQKLAAYEHYSAAQLRQQTNSIYGLINHLMLTATKSKNVSQQQRTTIFNNIKKYKAVEKKIMGTRLYKSV